MSLTSPVQFGRLARPEEFINFELAATHLGRQKQPQTSTLTSASTTVQRTPAVQAAPVKTPVVTVAPNGQPKVTLVELKSDTFTGVASLTHLPPAQKQNNRARGDANTSAVSLKTTGIDPAMCFKMDGSLDFLHSVKNGLASRSRATMKQVDQFVHNLQDLRKTLENKPSGHYSTYFMLNVPAGEAEQSRALLDKMRGKTLLDSHIQNFLMGKVVDNIHFDNYTVMPSPHSIQAPKKQFVLKYNLTR